MGHCLRNRVPILRDRFRAMALSSAGSTMSGSRKAFESKIDFKKILAERCTEAVSFKIPSPSAVLKRSEKVRRVANELLHLREEFEQRSDVFYQENTRVRSE